QHKQHLSDRIQPSGGYHAVPPPITGNFMPPKPDVVFHTAPISVETDHSAFTVQLMLTKSKPVSVTAVRPVSVVVPKIMNRVRVTKHHNKTPYELLHGRTPSIGFMRPFGCLVTILNTLDPLGKFEGKVDEGFLVGYSVNSKAFKNKEGDVAFDGKEHDAEKPKSAVNLSPSNSAISGEQDDITKKKDKGKSLVEYFTGNKDLNADFKDYFKDNSNDVSAAGTTVPTAGQNYSNSTNPISAAGPSNSNTSPTHGKSSLRDAYQPPDMLEREDIAYSDNENVGA
nr:retrovirus-related Pol polyprotein from transposon TNT 1-94 [Tanacetum cinerariifolium]